MHTFFPIPEAICTTPDCGGLASIFIDESNLCIHGSKVYAKKKLGSPSISVSWQYDAEVLTNIIANGFGFTHHEHNIKMFTKRYGASLEPNNETFKAFSFHHFEDKHGERSVVSGREKQVDTRLVVDMVFEASTTMHLEIPCVFAIVSGDSDMIPAAVKIAWFGYDVHVWSWKNSISSTFIKLLEDQKWRGHIWLHYLDGYLEELTVGKPELTNEFVGLATRRCQWRKYCHWRNKCYHEHTEEEKAFFESEGVKNAIGYDWCKYLKACKKRDCKYAHSVDELFCPTCEAKGEHLREDCPDNRD